jgi:hypothetical protein
MPKANPKAWFTSPIARISYKKVDKWAAYSSKFYPYFPTWAEAHAWMLAKADERLKKAQAELKSATMHRMKLKAMEDPTVGAQVPAHTKGEKE